MSCRRSSKKDKKRLAIAGFGDAGILLAIHLASSSEFEVVGISPKPLLVSGQELGHRLSHPEVWKTDYLMKYEQYKKLDNVEIIQGLIESVDAENNSLLVKTKDGEERKVDYDALVISSGVSNGFWRQNKMETVEEIEAGIEQQHKLLKEADTIAIVGGGATGVSSAYNLAKSFPNKKVHLFHTRDEPLPGYHPKVRTAVVNMLTEANVNVHPNHRAAIEDDNFSGTELTSDPIKWESGQPEFKADAVLWAVGRVQPNNQFIPADMLTEDGFVKVEKTLRVVGYNNVFSLGDIVSAYFIDPTALPGGSPFRCLYSWL